MVRIKFPIELSNFYLIKKFFIKLFLPVKLNKAPAKLSQSGFGSAQLSLFLIYVIKKIISCQQLSTADDNW